jgi:two-component system, response regulator, stage 0 sporulation protein F
MVVDDEESIRSLLRVVLEQVGHEVVEVSNGVEALRAHAQAPADIVITDLVMPEMEGLDVLRELKRRTPGVKIVAMSGGGVGQAGLYLDLATRFGAEMTFQKPFSLMAVREAVQRLLTRAA